jgi:type IV secretion system protein VirD4
MRTAKLCLAVVMALAAFSFTASTVTLCGLGTITEVGIPTVQWWGYLIVDMPNAEIQSFVNAWLVYGAVAGLIVAAMTVFRLLSNDKLMVGQGSRPLFGASKYASPKEGERSGLIYSNQPRPDCILLGRTDGFLRLFSRYVCLPRVPSVEHVMLYAKTGSGKGVSYVIPNCFSYEDSLVVLDIKGEAYDTTAGHREKVLQQDVFLFSPLAADGKTHCWNPLGGIDVSQPDYISRLQQRAFSIFPEVDGKERFWQNGARTGFLGISVLIAETPGMDLNPENVFRFFTRGDSLAVLTKMIEDRRASGNPYSQTCIDILSDYLSGTDEVVQGMKKHITTTMGLWFNPRIAAATARNDFDLRDLRRKRMTIYVSVMPSDLEQLGVLLRLFFLQLFDANVDATPDRDSTIVNRCHVLLDEMTSLPVMRTIAKAAGFARGFWLHFSFVVQSKNQVREEYKDNGAASLLENNGVEIVFGTNNQQLCNEASEMAGYNTVENVSRTMPRFFSFFRAKEQNENTSQTRRALILPQEVAGLPKDELLMFRASVAPFKLKRLCWYTDTNFKHLKQPSTEPPTVTYKLDRDDGSIKFSPGKAA